MNNKIYKITNLTNGKIYIGQTSKTAEERLKKHFYSRNEKSRAYDTPIRRALRKYEDLKYWKIECLYDNLDKKESNRLEVFEILKNNSTSNLIGYNVSTGAIGGDTLSKHPNLENIKKKISEKVMDSNNVNAKSIKLFNNEIEKVFGSAEGCTRYLNEIGINVTSCSVKRKCNGVIRNNKIGEYFVSWNKV